MRLHLFVRIGYQALRVRKRLLQHFLTLKNLFLPDGAKV